MDSKRILPLMKLDYSMPTKEINNPATNGKAGEKASSIIMMDKHMFIVLP